MPAPATAAAASTIASSTTRRGFMLPFLRER